MKILHTADIHLRAVGDSRWESVEKILEVARAEDVDLLVVAGDMFDRQIDAQKLKVPLRDCLEACGCRVVILPGNHDARALSRDDFYGQNVTVLAERDQIIDFDGSRVLGLPFEKIVGEKVLERLLWVKHNVRPGATNLLLYHGELLDLAYGGGGFGEEEEGGYMPVRLPFFDHLGVDYVLAGHFHSRFEFQKYLGGYFVYPGSPVSITKKETGVRSVNLFETGSPPRAVALDTEHYEEIVVDLNPFEGSHPLGEIRRQAEACHPKARVLLIVRGFVDLNELGLSEIDFSTGIQILKGGQVESVSSQWVDISEVVENDLFQRFVDKLRKSGETGERQETVRRLVIESMMDSFHANQGR